MFLHCCIFDWAVVSNPRDSRKFSHTTLASYRTCVDIFLLWCAQLFFQNVSCLGISVSDHHTRGGVCGESFVEAFSFNNDLFTRGRMSLCASSSAQAPSFFWWQTSFGRFKRCAFCWQNVHVVVYFLLPLPLHHLACR